MKENRPLLTISLLISNRIDTIPRCLDSLAPLMEAVPSELILIDTSKNPEVHALLLKYTEQVYEFEWCQDFAKARNEGLKRAKGEWFLFLDDDEWFVDAEPLIEFFRSGDYKNYERANYKIRNFYDPEYVQYNDCWAARMSRIHENTHFVGRVHEYMEPCFGKEKLIDALVYHSGYVFASDEERNKHAQRNIALLESLAKEEPRNVRWQAQLAQEYRSNMDWESLVSYCKSCISSKAQDMDVISKRQFASIYGGLVEGLIQIGQYEESIGWCQRILEKEQPETFLEIWIYLCWMEACFETGDWGKSEALANKYLELEKKHNIQDAWIEEQRKIAIVQNVFDPAYKKKAYSVLICIDLKKGSTQKLKDFYALLEWNETVNYVYEKLPICLIECMPVLEYEPIFSQIITDVWKREDFRNFVWVHILKWKEDTDRFLKLAHIFAQSEAQDDRIMYMRVLEQVRVMMENGMQAEAQAILKQVDQMFPIK